MYYKSFILNILFYIAGSVYMYARIIITLNNRRNIEALDDVGRNHGNEEIASVQNEMR